MRDHSCPCGTKRPFADCCKPYLDSRVEAATPELLMRSRYTAFVRGDRDYLAKTWHPDTVPKLEDTEPSNWIGLEVVAASVAEDGVHGQVEFIAKLIVSDKLGILHEVSAFEKVAGRWVYRSGEFKDDGTGPKTISMKTPCPCGSGEKFKRCHYQRGRLLSR